MKMFMRLMLVSVLVVVAAPSYSKEAWHTYSCEMLEGTSEDQVLTMASTWLKAAKGMKGGEGMKLYVAFPLAAQMGEGDFKLMLRAPTVAAWGLFWDGYKGSPAALIDKANEAFVDCPDSWLFEVNEIN